MPEPGAPKTRVPFWKKRFFKYAVVVVLLVSFSVIKYVAGAFGRAAGDAIHDKIVAKPAATPPAAATVAASTPAAPAPVPALANKPAQPAPPTPGLSETQNLIAHAPVNAINKAKDVIAKREGSGQGRDAVGAITDGDAPAPPADKPAPHAAAPQTVATSSSIAPGVSATNSEVMAASEASPAFRSFVANAKVNGVFQGATPRVMLNGRLTRAGDTVDTSLGITFDSIDPEKKTILFKDKSGAIVTRRY